MAAAMDLSLYTLSEVKIPISPAISQLRASLLFFGFTAACLPIHPPPPNPAHVTYTYRASRIDRPEG